MKSIAILFAIQCIITTSVAQSLQGFVINEKDKPVESATVSLLKSGDSSAVKFTVTGKDWNYKFVSIKERDYLISVTHVGFTSSFSSNFIYNGGIKAFYKGKN